ncbi:immunoglobulin iota chain [Acomys russatus]|uniref:immunoglobulin iota chain n=1 Tax=Acomys russatus TaxID=60746 RepID=UPI0021E1DE26|nr:immunoglobulin iota chain [Acomys russatus]
MVWTPVLLMLLAWLTGKGTFGAPSLLAFSLAVLCLSDGLVPIFPGCGPQPMLHQPPSASSSLGTTIRLTCTLSRNHNIGIYSIYWYQQRPGHPPRFLLRYFSHLDKHQGPKVPPRFSGSKYVAGNLGYLSISELQPEDEAVYYCAAGLRREEKEKGMERQWGGEK